MNLLSIVVSGDVERWQREEISLKRRADLYALAVGSQTLRDRLAGQTGTSLGARLAKTWKQRLYANPKNPAAMVYSKAPNIISAFLADTVVLPKKGKHLAIPTGFNRSGGQRGGKVLVTPKQMIASHQSFTRPRKDGPGLIWFLTVNKAESRSSRTNTQGELVPGKIRQMAFAGGLVKVGRYGRRTRDIVKARAVPMFVLVPQVRHSRRIDADAEVQRIEQEIPGYLAEAYEIYDTGTET